LASFDNVPEGAPVAEQTFRFQDGAAYERLMGVWSRSVGEIFLDWLKPDTRLRWLDVGCGNGAFTERIVERCAPSEVQGIDPSEGQLKYARERPALRHVTFQLGDAMALPFPAARFDAAVMALVLVFVPDPVKAVGEMVRVVRRGGLVAAYMWDMLGGGFPPEPIVAEVRAMGAVPAFPPQLAASRMDGLRDLWTGAGLEAVETREIKVERTFADFDDFWTANMASASIAAAIASLAPEATAELKQRVRARLPAEADGRVICHARANAVKGIRPR
jgi:ubiquinone/menaquinone biosynthesis C-methylase UbiE